MNNHKKEIPIAEKKLTQLAERFIDFLQSNYAEIIDVNTAAEVLQIRNKRRLTDIISVLEGIDMVEKVDKNKIIWKGSNCFTNDSEFENKQHQLNADISHLDNLLGTADSHISQLKQSLENVTKEPCNMKFAYITKEDLGIVYPSKNIILLKSSDQLNITYPNAIEESQINKIKKYKVNIRSFTDDPSVFYLPVTANSQQRPLQEIKNATETDSSNVECNEVDQNYSKLLDMESYDAFGVLTDYEAASDIFSDFN